MGRKTIAVFISALYEDMVRQTVEGLLSAARGEDMKILFFTSFADNHTSRSYDLYQDYDKGDFVVYLLPDLKEYDALISFDTYMTGSFIGPINELKDAVSIPVVTMGAVKEGTYSIVNDQDRSFREVIEHLIEKHNCRDIVHVAGPLERSFCSVRNAVSASWMTFWRPMQRKATKSSRMPSSASMTTRPSESSARWRKKASVFPMMCS